MPKPKVFISGTSRDLKSYREVVTAWAEQQDYDPVVQDYFGVQSDYGTVVQMLREKLAPCDAVIHLAGMFYGFEPTNRPSGEMRRSYTQLEFELGKEFQRQVFRFIAREDYKPDNEFTQTDEQAELQKLHRQRLMQGNEAWSATSRTTGNELYYEFSNHEELRKLLEHIEIKATLAQPQNLPLVGTLIKGRDEFIEQLRAVLVNKPSHIAAVTAKQAIHGLGGVGKTRVAVEYAKRYSHHYTALLFITADSPANLQRNLANLCGALVLNLPEKDATEQEVQVAAALRWLREHAGWFLIVDNVDTPDAAKAVESLLQQFNSGHIVVTSRLSQWGEAVQELSLDVISESAAQEFLLERTNGKRKAAATDDADARALAFALGRLPLALEQAGAFIVKHHTSFKAYLDRWKQQEAKVLEWHDQRTMKYPASVATTWQTSFAQLTDDGRGLLNVLCWLAPDPIPLSMIEKLSTIDDEPPIDIETGIADLAEYSLLKWSSDQYDSVEIHRLVEEITRYRLDESERNSWLQRALRMVDDFVPKSSSADPRTWAVWNKLESHAGAAIYHANAIELAPFPMELMNKLGLYLFHRCDFRKCEPLLRRSLELEQRPVESKSSAAVALKLGNLAAVLKVTGRMGEAERMSRESFEILENGLKHESGAEQLAFVMPLNNRGQVLSENLKFEEAERLFRRGIEICESFDTDGVKNEGRLKLLSNLGLLLQNTKRLKEAEELMRHAISWQRSLADFSPLDKALLLHNLASILRYKLEFVEAEALIRESIQIKEQYFDSDNHQIAVGLSVLADILKSTTRLEEAGVLFSRCVNIAENCFGLDTTPVAHEQSNLATVMYELGRKDEAERLIRLSTATYLRRGTEWDYREAVSNLLFLARILQETNRNHEAEKALWAAYLGSVRYNEMDKNITYAVIVMLVPIIQRNHGVSEDDALAKIQARLRGDAQ